MTFKKILSEQQIVELLQDFEGGWTVAECSVIYRVSIRTVYRILADYNVPHQNGREYAERKKKRPKRKKPLQPCGTNAAYARHIKNGEIADEACLAAHAENVREARKK